MVTGFGCYGIRTICLTSRRYQMMSFIPLAWDQNGIFLPCSHRKPWRFLAVMVKVPVFSDFAIVKSSWYWCLIFLSNGTVVVVPPTTRQLSIILNIVQVDIVKTSWVSLWSAALHWRYRSHLLDDWLYTKQGHLWPPVSDQIGTETVRTPFGALTFEMTTSKRPAMVSLLTMSIFPLSYLLSGPLQVLRVRCKATWYSPHCGQIGFSWKQFRLRSELPGASFPIVTQAFRIVYRQFWRRILGKPRNSEAQIELVLTGPFLRRLFSSNQLALV